MLRILRSGHAHTQLATVATAFRRGSSAIGPELVSGLLWVLVASRSCWQSAVSSSPVSRFANCGSMFSRHLTQK